MNNLVKKLSLVFAAGCFGGLLNSPASCSESLQLGERVEPGLGLSPGRMSY